MKTTLKRIGAGYRSTCIKAACFAEKHATAIMLFVGVALLTGGLTELSAAQGRGPSNTFSEADFDDTLIRNSVGNLFKLIEGAFGALIMVVAGLGAIVAAAMGAYRAAVGMLVVAVGAFILRALVSLFFGTDYQDYTAGSAATN
ncbi:MAG: hypothetical protein U0136_16995 [Bdellovibrionota bacterium]